MCAVVTDSLAVQVVQFQTLVQLPLVASLMASVQTLPYNATRHVTTNVTSLLVTPPRVVDRALSTAKAATRATITLATTPQVVSKRSSPTANCVQTTSVQLLA